MWKEFSLFYHLMECAGNNKQRDWHMVGVLLGCRNVRASVGGAKAYMQSLLTMQAFVGLPCMRITGIFTLFPNCFFFCS